MKKVFMAGMAMVAIIAVRMVLSYMYTELAAEVFTRISMTALFFYCVFRVGNRRRELEIK